MNCEISHAQGPFGSLGVEPYDWEAGAAAAGAAAAGASLELPPLNIPVMAWPTVCPTAEPMATPPAVAAICWNIEGWAGAAPIGAPTAAGGAAATADGGGAARAAAAGGGGAARAAGAGAAICLKHDEDKLIIVFTLSFT